MMLLQTPASIARTRAYSLPAFPMKHVMRCVLSRYGNGILLSSTFKQNQHRTSSLSAERSILARSYYTGAGLCLGMANHIQDAYTLNSNAIQSCRAIHFAPHRVRQKVISASDAVSIIRNGDTICASGFVSQGSPEAVLEAIGKRYEKTGSPNNLTVLFGGGPGDSDKRGLNHLAKTKPDGQPPMMKRSIGALYGQVPQITNLAISDQVEAWTLPLGSISRMIRAQSTHSPGHITSVGIGTYVDPDLDGGAVNEAARNSKLHKELVSKITLNDKDVLMYKALPIDVAIIRGTTADGQGNISMEEESLLCDQKIIAAAARNSGGIVIAQVKRLAANGSLPSRSIAVPGPLVDCVVVVDEDKHNEYHPMSFEQRSNPAFTGDLHVAQDTSTKMPLDVRKIIARRAFFVLQPNSIVNLGKGLPEGMASVAAEEGMLDYVTLSTEAGVFGGHPAAGKSFGPSSNPSAILEMNQIFDFFDGGGLDKCFLGAGQIDASGNVNVSRMEGDRLNGPGGFIDVSQSTKDIVFLSSLTTSGLELSVPGDGTLKVEKEGKIKKFVPQVLEKTFSGDEAVRRGQNVYYVTERAVFQRTAAHDTLELIEVAPGLDLERDVLDQMDFDPVISPNLKVMDHRIFQKDVMNIRSELFGTLEERCTYHESEHTLFLELFGITIDTEDDIQWLKGGLAEILDPLVEKHGLIRMVVTYDGFSIRNGLEEKYGKAVADLEKNFYRSVQRFAGTAFCRSKLRTELSLCEWNEGNKEGRDWDKEQKGEEEETSDTDVVESGLLIFNHLEDDATTLFGAEEKIAA